MSSELKSLTERLVRDGHVVIRSDGISTIPKGRGKVVFYRNGKQKFTRAAVRLDGETVESVLLLYRIGGHTKALRITT